MFFNGVFAPPFDVQTISDQLIQQAKNSAVIDELQALSDVRTKLKCGQSGSANVSRYDPNFSIEGGTVGRVNMGKWQLDLAGSCSWTCQQGQPPDCCCSCTVTCNFNGSLSKIWTFQPWGFNDLNIGFLPVWMLTLMYQSSAYHVATGMYVIVGTFNDTQSQQFRVCDN
jgi:hypothetical protein